jgi:hypothetical protein
VPLVVGGRTRVGFPGAPGWTTTGVAGAVSCARTRKEEKLARVLAAASTPEHAAPLNTTRISQVHFTERGLTCRKYLIIVGLTLSHLAETSARLCTKMGNEKDDSPIHSSYFATMDGTFFRISGKILAPSPTRRRGSSASSHHLQFAFLPSQTGSIGATLLPEMGWEKWEFRRLLKVNSIRRKDAISQNDI